MNKEGNAVAEMDRRKEVKAEWEREPETFPVFLKENPEIFQEVGVGQKRENEALLEVPRLGALVSFVTPCGLCRR